MAEDGNLAGAGPEAQILEERLLGSCRLFGSARYPFGQRGGRHFFVGFSFVDIN